MLRIEPETRSPPTTSSSDSISFAPAEPAQRPVKLLVLQIGIRIPSIDSGRPAGPYAYPAFPNAIRPEPPRTGSGEPNQLSVCDRRSALLPGSSVGPSGAIDRP